MNRKQYEKMRKALMDEAQRLLDAGDTEGAQAKMQEVKDLDGKWDAIAQAQAEFQALNTDPVAAIRVGEGAAMGDTAGEGIPDTPEKARKSDLYRTAWAKEMMQLEMSREERQVYDLVNRDFHNEASTSYTHTTQNTGILIPETVTKGIWDMAGEMYPYLDDITKTYVNGTLTMIQADTSTDAGWYEEDTPTEDGKETFRKFTLSGCELSRAAKVSWKLREMAIEDFIPYIQRKIAEKMGAAAGYGVTHGKGNADPRKPEPTGVVTALLAQEGTPRVMAYGKGKVPTYEDMTGARAKVRTQYARGMKIYASSATIWTKLARIKDGQGNPMFVPDPINGGAYRILGMEVREDGAMQDGEVLLSNAVQGYHANINKELSVMTEEHIKDRETDYVGYAIMDGNIVTEEAHVLLVEEIPEAGAGSQTGEDSQAGTGGKG